MALAMIDIDYFKAYNDMYGHPEGDTCLRLIAGVLDRSVRRAGDVVARYGGEEFGIILPRVDVEQAELFGEKLCVAVREQQIAHAGSSFTIVTISVGIASGIPVENGASEFLARADHALYSAKHHGRNCWKSA
jgi:diguanylate cyclase (GGDEF)-like protein